MNCERLQRKGVTSDYNEVTTMPHRRKKDKGGFCPGLKYQPDESWLYLAVHKWEEDCVEVPLSTLALLFIRRFALIKSANIRFVLDHTQGDGGVSFRIKKDELPFYTSEQLNEPVPLEVTC